MVTREYTPGGRLRAQRFHAPQGKVVGNPALTVSWWLRNALSAPRRPDCTVYDATGQPIAVIDGETRERRPLPASARA